MDGLLVLSNGSVFQGKLRGAAKAVSGEVIFNTSMTGYQEILTDPSYCGQIVTMTYPHIGNYGVNPEDVESRQSFASGMIVKELSRMTSNWRASESLDAYLARLNLTVLEGLDTRALVINLRSQGAVPGLIAPAVGADIEALKKEAASLPGMEGRNLAKEVSIQSSYSWENSNGESGPVSGNSSSNGTPGFMESAVPAEKKFKVIAYDFGIKYNILRRLASRGVEVEVVPYDTPAETVLAAKPDGVFLSNGPGDPEPVAAGVAAVKALLGKVPVFGICLGHQILTLALGGKSYKLKFGHHGANHPVLNLATGKVEITSQNHGFAVEGSSLPDSVEVTHKSLNDETVEGIRSRLYPAFSVQYHPEASPGPQDSDYLFDQFLSLMESS